MRILIDTGSVVLVLMLGAVIRVVRYANEARARLQDLRDELDNRASKLASNPITSSVIEKRVLVSNVRPFKKRQSVKLS